MGVVVSGDRGRVVGDKGVVLVIRFAWVEEARDTSATNKSESIENLVQFFFELFFCQFVISDYVSSGLANSD